MRRTHGKSVELHVVHDGCLMILVYAQLQHQAAGGGPMECVRQPLLHMEYAGTGNNKWEQTGLSCLCMRSVAGPTELLQGSQGSWQHAEARHWEAGHGPQGGQPVPATPLVSPEAAVLHLQHGSPLCCRLST